MNQALMSSLFASNSQPSVPSNQALISALSVCNFQPSATALAVPNPPSSAAKADSMTVNPPTQDTIATLEKVYPVTNFKLQILLKR